MADVVREDRRSFEFSEQSVSQVVPGHDEIVKELAGHAQSSECVVVRDMFDDMVDDASYIGSYVGRHVTYI